jgi:magnesium transporter
MIRVMHLSDDQAALIETDERAVDRPGLKWIDVLAPTEQLLEPLAKRFGLHKLAVEDCLHLGQRPKFEEYPNHHFIVLQGFSCSSDVSQPLLHELHTFLGPDWVITIHEHPLPALEVARMRMAAEPSGSFGRGADFVAYAVADALVDGNLPVLDAFTAELEELEEQIFEHSRPSQLERLFALKRTLVHLRKVLSPQRDVVGLLSRRGMTHVQDRTTLYFRDVYDHLVRVYEQLEAARDLLGNAKDAWLSVVANRTNDITKQLTIFATLFLPLSFITGFFGQNFDVLSGRGYLWSMLALVFLVPVVLVGWFRYKRWI